MDAEERARREAVRRAMAGEPVASIMAALGRSRRWVFKWLTRYQPKRADWAGSRSRAPAVVANKSSAELEALVLKVRARLDADPWAQVGAAAIAWELSKLGVRPLPELRTIERILQRAGVRRRPQRVRYVAKGTPYPAPVAPGPNAVQEADVIGPRHLAGGVLFYVLSAVDLGRHAVAWEIMASKADRATAEALLRLWSRLGWSCPAFVETLMLGPNSPRKECPRAKDQTRVSGGVPCPRGRARALVGQDPEGRCPRAGRVDERAARVGQAR